MAEIQKFKCTEEGCSAEIVYNPDKDTPLIATFRRLSSKPLKTKATTEEREVIAYLTCANGHKRPYKVKKTYKISI